MIILNWVLRKQDVKGVHMFQGRVQWWDPVNTKMSLQGFIKDRELLDQLSEYQFIKNSGPWS
jgi:hypothetical protein